MAAEFDDYPEKLPARGELLELLSEAVHRMSHDLAAIRGLLERHSAVVEGYQRGGLLGARAARKQTSTRERA